MDIAFAQSDSDIPLPQHLRIDKIVQTDPEIQHYAFSLDEMKTPDWWFSNHNMYSEDIADKKDLSRVEVINIGHYRENKFNREYFLTISAISFAGTHRFPAVFSIICIVAALLLAAFRFLLSSSALPDRRPFKKINLTNHEDEEHERLIAYLGKNYDNPELSVELVSENTGLSRIQIPELLKKYHATLFRNYVNSIRVEEAKRLLRETDRQITEIALAVGYKYPSTFNRIFKGFCNVSPMEYRKRNR
jgi:AraC-like DNA-binding protein